METFDRALEILRTAENVAGSGFPGPEWTFLIDDAGSVRMIADCDWALTSLRLEYGAEAVCRVHRRQNAVWVEGEDRNGTFRVNGSPAKLRESSSAPALLYAGR